VLAAEYDALDVAVIDHEQSTAGEQQEIDVQLAAAAVRDQHVAQHRRRNRLERPHDLFARPEPAPAPVGPGECHREQRHEHDGDGRLHDDVVDVHAPRLACQARSSFAPPGSRNSASRQRAATRSPAPSANGRCSSLKSDGRISIRSTPCAPRTTISVSPGMRE
jgi:hypothetical protein